MLSLIAAHTLDLPQMLNVSLLVVLPGAAAAWYALQRSRDTQLSSPGRLLWRGVVAGTVCAVVVPTVLLTELVTVAAATAHLFLVGSRLALTLCIAVGCLNALMHTTRTSHFALVTDLGVSCAAAMAIVWATTIESIAGSGLTSSQPAFLLALVPVALDVVLLQICIGLLIADRRSSYSHALLLACVPVALVCADLAFARELLNGGGSIAAYTGSFTGSWTPPLAGIGWPAAGILLALSAKLARRADHDDAHQLRHVWLWESAWVMFPVALLFTTVTTALTIAPIHETARNVALMIIFAASVRLITQRISAAHRIRRAQRDPLTGVLTHSMFQSTLAIQVMRCVEDRTSLSLLMMDVDDFELLNDVIGHENGDLFLRTIARTIETHMRNQGITFRLGGDEFAVILPGVTLDEASEIAVRLATACEAIQPPGGHQSSMTMALASIPGHTFDAQELVRLCDGTLYWGKLNGKQSLTVYDPAIVEVLTPEQRVLSIERHAQFRTILGLARALDARDGYTARHSQNVARFAIAIATEMGWETEMIELIRIAGLLHDVGKIGVQDSTLRKSGNLSEAEWNEMRNHPMLSARVIEGVAPPEIIPWVISHHERVDGRGYPHGLVGDAIPLPARVLAVADAFDAMTSSRSYRPGMDPVAAMQEIVACTGTQFDEVVVRALLTAVKNGAIVIEQQRQQPAAAPVTEVRMQDPEFLPDLHVAESGEEHQEAA